MQPGNKPSRPPWQVDQTTTKPGPTHPKAKGTPHPKKRRNQTRPTPKTTNQEPQTRNQKKTKKEKQHQNNKKQNIIETRGLCPATPLVSAFVSFIVVGGGFGVVLVVCFGCVLGVFLFCFCFVFCFVLFFFCVGGGGIVRFI
jgi:uncharacterized membrane protein